MGFWKEEIVLEPMRWRWLCRWRAVTSAGGLPGWRWRVEEGYLGSRSFLGWKEDGRRL